MQAQLENRLQQLRAEFESGQKMLADLEAKKENLRNTLLRISGAIQILEEVLMPPEDEEKENGSVPLVEDTVNFKNFETLEQV